MPFGARTTPLLLCLLATVLDFSPAYAAQACDPDKILRQNVETYNANLTVWLSYVNNLVRSTQSSSSDSVGISYAGIA
jgi:hypothetical protein